ncbi:M1 family metallopeptidase [Nocardioides sp.]|uniref:M1 family metallopeptidase n=1 Tax=Nocardioides sp. TaxID=35761 RepID=UPI0027347138|nr:M1 family metallopeptidase [Nocardioides sp.]MDP3891563.1 M1 family metallopeptidase [Nocardioides sp.]
MSRSLGGAGLPALALALVLACAVSTLPAASTPATSPRPGAPGMGDPYFPQDGNGGYDVLHYGVRNRYRFARQHLSGRTRITARATQNLSRFHLDFLLPVTQVRVNGRRADFSRPNRHELRIRPQRQLARGSRFKVTVTYAGSPARVGWRGERNWLANRDEVVTMNQPHMAAWWFPANDHPRDKAAMDVRIVVPKGRQVVSNGVLVQRRKRARTTLWHWRAVEPMAPYLAFFAAGRFRIDSGTSAGLPWVAAVSKQLPRSRRASAMRSMRRSPELVRWLESQVGGYPFATTGGVTTSLRSGFALENQTRPTYPVVHGDMTWLLVHELAHQWFGNHVAVRNWRDIWLNEGLATFFEARYVETHGGESAAQWLLRNHAERGPGSSFWLVPIGDPGKNRMFHEAVYVRGGMTIQALRQRIGEESFWTLIRTWVQRHGGGNASTEDFRALAEEVSGEDLGAFFTAWLVTPAKPAATSANGFG